VGEIEPAWDSDPRFSPDGRTVVFQRHYGSGDVGFELTDIFLVNVDGTGETNLTKTGDQATFNGLPAFAPDGRAIIFVSSPVDATDAGQGAHINDDIHVMSTDGTGRRRLTTDPRGDTRPIFSPDGARIAFVRDADPDPERSHPEVFLMNADGSGEVQLTDTPDGAVVADWR
jgi:Tol biopolymer transport system component